MTLTDTYANRRRAVKGIMTVKYTMAKSHNVSTVELQVLLLLGLSDSICNIPDKILLFSRIVCPVCRMFILGSTLD